MLLTGALHALWQVLQKLLASVAMGKAVLLITADPSFVATLLDAQMRACRVWLLTDGSVAASSLQSTADWTLPWSSFLSSCLDITVPHVAGGSPGTHQVPLQCIVASKQDAPPEWMSQQRLHAQQSLIEGVLDAHHSRLEMAKAEAREPHLETTIVFDSCYNAPEQTAPVGFRACKYVFECS